jgi:large subunit ribosomal protein L25
LTIARGAPRRKGVAAMSEIVLSVELRPQIGTGGARAARRDGLVPGVIYGGERGSVAITMKSKDLMKALAEGRLRSHMIQIEHKGERQPVIVRDIQFHPVSDLPIHFDLYRVEKGQIITVEVPVRFRNEGLSPGIKRGGALNVVRHVVELDCPADAIPEFIEVNLEGLEIGDSVHISAVSLPEGVRPKIRDRDFTIATVTGAGAALPEIAEAEAAPPVETEVIKKGKAEEEEPAAKEAKAGKDKGKEQA